MTPQQTTTSFKLRFPQSVRHTLLK